MNRRQFLSLSSVSALCVLSGNHLFAAKNQGVQTRGTGLVFDEIYFEHWLEPGHPESPARLKAVIDLLETSLLLSQLNMINPIQDVLPYMNPIHTQQHLNSIKLKYGHSHEAAIAVVAGVLAATEAVCNGKLNNAFCATRPPGHHAINTGKVEGFCFYNSIAVAARYAQTKFNLKKILIVDWDYHHGNGTEAAFYDDPSVLFFSTHDLYAYPGTGSPEKKGEGDGIGFNINVHLDCGTTDNDIINAFDKYLLPAVEKFKPDLILISAGFDSRKDDLLGCYDITDNGYIELTKIVMSLANKYCDGRIVSILEGGYNVTGLASAVVAHVDTLLTYH
jgi:acetoin utilization deacetylase AcuC-like enzyme